jgi:hypothetical protein
MSKNRDNRNVEAEVEPEEVVIKPVVPSCTCLARTESDYELHADTCDYKHHEYRARGRVVNANTSEREGGR